MKEGEYTPINMHILSHAFPGVCFHTIDPDVAVREYKLWYRKFVANREPPENLVNNYKELVEFHTSTHMNEIPYDQNWQLVEQTNNVLILRHRARHSTD